MADQFGWDNNFGITRNKKRSPHQGVLDRLDSAWIDVTDEYAKLSMLLKGGTASWSMIETQKRILREACDTLSALL